MKKEFKMYLKDNEDGLIYIGKSYGNDKWYYEDININLDDYSFYKTSRWARKVDIEDFNNYKYSFFLLIKKNDERIKNLDLTIKFLNENKIDYRFLTSFFYFDPYKFIKIIEL